MNTLEDITGTTQINYALQKQAKTKLSELEKFNEKEAKKAAEDFEAFFITSTLESMFAGIKTDGLMGGGTAEKIYRSMMFDEYGKLMAKNGGIGVSDQIMASIIAMQEMSTQGYTTIK